MYYNAEIPKRNFEDRLKLKNSILESGATCHMTPDISDFILGSLVEIDKCIEVADGHFITEKQTGQVQIKMCDDNGKTFNDRLYIVLLAPYLCGGLLSIITVINSSHSRLFHKVFYTVFFSDNEQNAATLPRNAQRKHEFLVKTKENSKSQNKIPTRIISLGLLHMRLGHSFTR